MESPPQADAAALARARAQGRRLSARLARVAVWGLALPSAILVAAACGHAPPAPAVTSGAGAGAGAGADASAAETALPPEDQGPPPPDAHFQDWQDTSFGTYLIPKEPFWDADGGFDVIFHFHAAHMAEHDYREVGPRAVVVSAAFGLFSGKYSDAFKNPNRFQAMLDEVTRLARTATGEPRLHVKRIALVAWSAGYGSIGRILSVPRYLALIDTVILLDGLHADYAKTGRGPASKSAASNGATSGRRLNTKALGVFVKFATQAASGHRLMVLTHSSIVPPGYASTTETCDYLARKAGAPLVKTKEEVGDEMVVIEKADVGDFHMVGFEGETKHDHINHLHLLGGLMRTYLVPRWAAGASPDATAPP